MPEPRTRRPPLTVNIGITGHRAAILPPGVINALELAVDEVLRGLREAAERIQAQSVSISSVRPAELRLHTPLASGADQLAARSAYASGYRVLALLPFEPDEYRKDFEPGDELDSFDRALDGAHEVSAMAGDGADRPGAYVAVGKALIAKADVMVAVWDGGEGNGPGGTAHVVDLALAGGLPVIHVAIDRVCDAISLRLLTGGDAAHPVVLPFGEPGDYERLLRGALAPGAVSDQGTARLGYWADCFCRNRI